MKVFLAGLLIVSTMAFGQRAGGLGRGLGGFGHGRTAVTGARRGSFVGNRLGPRVFGPSYYPLGWQPYLGDEAYSYAPPPPNVIVVQPPPAVPAALATPAQPVIHEYNFSEAAAASPAPVEQRTFVIALKDGSKASAIAFWVQERTLRYIDSDGYGRHVALSEVDRALTQKLNREQQLPLSLPPG